MRVRVGRDAVRGQVIPNPRIFFRRKNRVRLERLIAGEDRAIARHRGEFVEGADRAQLHAHVEQS